MILGFEHVAVYFLEVVNCKVAIVIYSFAWFAQPQVILLLGVEKNDKYD